MAKNPDQSQRKLSNVLILSSGTSSEDSLRLSTDSPVSSVWSQDVGSLAVKFLPLSVSSRRGVAGSWHGNVSRNAGYNGDYLRHVGVVQLAPLNLNVEVNIPPV